MAKKLLAGTVATAAGIALLLGGGGTLAYWNSSTSDAAHAIVAGTLTVDDSGKAGVWTSEDGDVIDLADYNIVPGDVLTYSKTVLVTAIGDSMTAGLELAPGSIKAASDSAADVALAKRLTSTAVVTATGDGVTAVDEVSYEIVAGSKGITALPVDVTVTVTFPSEKDTADNDAQSGSVSLSALAITLTQN